jgi:hypothetical protein
MTKPLAVVSNYLALIAGLRARVLELGVSFETIDQVAGWCDGYASKVLAPEPSLGHKTKRAMGPMAFDAVLGALAVKLLLVPDPDQLRYIKRNRYFVHRVQAPPRRMLANGTHAYVAHRVTHEMLRQMAPSGGRARAAALTPLQRSKIARKAARARWARSKSNASRTACPRHTPEPTPPRLDMAQPAPSATKAGP